MQGVRLAGAKREILPLRWRITYDLNMSRIPYLRISLLCATLLLGGGSAQAGDAARLAALAEEGNVYAQFAMAVRYDDGLGFPQDLSLALAWYTRAAEGGLVDAQFMLGRIHGQGRGVRQNPALAFYWFNIAAASGHPRAAALRDQHRAQLSPPERRRMEAKATAWHASHPAAVTCRFRHCTYPRWTPRPRWNLLDPEDDRPR